MEVRNDAEPDPCSGASGAATAAEESCPAGAQGWEKAGLRSFTQEDTQLTILTIAQLAQKNAAHDYKPTFAHSCLIGASNGI